MRATVNGEGRGRKLTTIFQAPGQGPVVQGKNIGGGVPQTKETMNKGKARKNAGHAARTTNR